MISLVLDVETIPQATADLEKIMPSDILNPGMPDELANPVEPNWEEKCPKYAGNEEKRAVWISEKGKKWDAEQVSAREKWQIGTLDARARFVENAALHADRGHVKMIGVKKFEGAELIETRIFLWESDKKIAQDLMTGFADKGVAVMPFMLEKQMIAAATNYLVAAQCVEIITDTGTGPKQVKYLTQKPHIITFYGNTFDLPFIARRGAILGAPGFFSFLRKHRRGRYLDSELFVDLCEEWKLGDREEKSGGLESLGTLLGHNGAKLGRGKNFSKWYAECPEEGVHYLLGDLSITEHIARAMGIIQ